MPVERPLGACPPRRPWCGAARRAAGAALAVVGYILSPLSWWNDAFVNIPISIALAAVAERLLGIPMDVGFVAAYWATNVLGFILMAVGGEAAFRGRTSRKSLALSILASTAYTLVVVGVIRAFT